MKPLWIVAAALAVSALGASLAGGGTPMDQLAAPEGYAKLLREYVKRVPLETGAFETRFDYAAFHAAEDRDELRDTLREAFLSVEPRALSRDARYAWAVNAYNFLIIDRVIDAYRDDDGRALDSIADIGAGEFAVFEEPWIEVGGRTYSLNAFENHFLFLDVDRGSGSLPEGLDPRFHFALVCAAKGCPSLWPEPFTSEALDAQLDAATRNALASPRQVRLHNARVHVSQVFAWYEADFGGKPGVAAFLERYAPGVGAVDPDIILADLEWDWSLNRP